MRNNYSCNPSDGARHSITKAFSNVVCFIVLALLVLPAGCGYHIRKAPSVDSVRLGRIVNNTTEPKLQDKLYESLSLSLMKNGIRIKNSAEYELKGSIDDIEIRGTAEADGVAIQYEVRISGNFVLIGPDGKTKKLRNSNVFIVTFGTTGAMEHVIAQKETAIMISLDNMSSEIVTSILH
jgi:hypothetical protein